MSARNLARAVVTPHSTDPASISGAPPLKVPVHQKLILAAVWFTPFQLALTINVGFPLKISELLIVVAVITRVFERPVAVGDRVTSRAASIWLSLFLGMFLVSATFNLLITSSTEPLPNGFTRSLITDLVLYTAYGVLVVVVWNLMRDIDVDRIMRAMIVSTWLCGGAVLFQWVLITIGVTAPLVALNFRIDGNGLDLTGTGANGDAVRSGPFYEGQHLGFYMGAMLIVALLRRSYLAAFVALASIFYSQSTTPLLGFALGVVVVLVFRLNVKFAIATLGALAVVAIIVLILEPLRTLMQFQLAKLGVNLAPQVGNATLSLDLRSAKTEIAFRIMADNPLLGVGPGRYGQRFFDYVDEYPIPDYYVTIFHRAIPENAYGQIGAESGLLALLLYTGFLVSLLLIAWRGSPLALILAIYAFVGIATQSSWSFIPSWVIFGLLAHKILPVSSSKRSRGKAARAGETGEVAKMRVAQDSPVSSTRTPDR